MIERINAHFDFSPMQLRGLFMWGLILLAATIVLAVRDATRPMPAPIHLSGEEEIPVGFSGSFLIDPNTAPLDSLELLPGVGPEIAEKITQRRSVRPFVTEAELIEVSGIGPKTFERIRPYLKIRREAFVRP